METRMRHRVKMRRHRTFWEKFSKRFVLNPKFKWVVFTIALMIGASFHNETKGSSAYAGGIIISNGVPEPSSVSLMVIGGAAFLLARRRRKSD